MVTIVVRLFLQQVLPSFDEFRLPPNTLRTRMENLAKHICKRDPRERLQTMVDFLHELVEAINEPA